MGECASRPVQEDMQKHVLQENKRNEDRFYYYPLKNCTIESILSCTKAQVLVKNLNYLEKKRDFYMQKIEGIESITDIPELLIEVQKGVNLIGQPYCLNSGKPFVEVSLEPGGPVMRTFEADMFTPCWYKFFECKELVPYNTIVFRVLCHKKFKDTSLGYYKIHVSELMNQLVTENWYELEQSPSGGMLRLRVQFIHNEKSFIKSMLADLNTRIKSITLMIKALTSE